MRCSNTKPIFYEQLTRYSAGPEPPVEILNPYMDIKQLQDYIIDDKPFYHRSRLIEAGRRVFIVEDFSDFQSPEFILNVYETPDGVTIAEVKKREE